MLQPITTLNEVAETATGLRDLVTPKGTVTREQQVWMLTNLFNGGLDLVKMFGVAPVVTVSTYHKQTSAKPRIEGLDYAPVPGMKTTAHVGPITRMWRTQEGHLVFTLYDYNRQPSPEQIAEALAQGKKPAQPFTCVRIEGIRSVTPGAPFQGF